MKQSIYHITNIYLIDNKCSFDTKKKKKKKDFKHGGAQVAISQ